MRDIKPLLYGLQNWLIYGDHSLPSRGVMDRLRDADLYNTYTRPIMIIYLLNFPVTQVRHMHLSVRYVTVFIYKQVRNTI